MARGILLDFAGARGVESMNKGECASMDDVKAALEKQGMADFEFMEGDAILFRYGWESHWDDPATFNDGQPGICMDVALGRRGGQGRCHRRRHLGGHGSLIRTSPAARSASTSTCRPGTASSIRRT